MTRPADSAVREQALDIHRSFAVAAPAGSGKTGLLTRRMLKLLAVCDSPEQILAITFTRKAAAEMRQRITDALDLAGREQPPADDYERQLWTDARAVLVQDRRQDWQLVSTPARLRILTIDGLCRNLARQLAVESALGEAPEPLDDAEPLYRQAVRALLAELETNSETADCLAILLEHLDNDLNQVEGLLVSLAGKREQWLQVILASRDNRALLESFLESTIVETLQRVQQQLQPVGADIALLADYAAANLRHLNIKHQLQDCLGLAGLPEATPENRNLWSAICQLLLTNGDNWRRVIDKRAGFPTARDSVDPQQADARKQQWQQLLDWCTASPQLLDALLDVRYLPEPGYSDSHWQVLDALTRLLPRLAATLALLARQERRCDFTEITLSAIRGLGEEEQPTDLSLKLDCQLRHILVDEFQDTSSVQYQLLERLVEGWHPGDGRTLFIVGDGMQSLYSFRNANVGLFLEARQQPLNQVFLEPLDLTVNFRSDGGIIRWINRTFASIFPAAADISRGAVPYTAATAARPESLSAPVTLTLLPADAGTATEAQQVVNLIARARADHPEGTIAILARTRSQLREIIEAMRTASISWQANDIDPLASRMPVIDLLSLTRALLDPADRIAWLAILRAPWAGLNLYDLHRLANTPVPDNPGSSDGRLPWLPGQIFSKSLGEHLSAEGRRILDRVAPVLETAMNNGGRKPLRMQVEGVWLALGGPAALTDAKQLSWCQQYFDLLEARGGERGQMDMAEFEAAVSKLYAAPLCRSPNPVQVMTIHKAKGLEFDTVIVPGLGNGGRPQDTELLYWRQRIDRQGRLQLLLSPLVATGEDKTALLTHLKREAGIKQKLEDARVLYVACTRARSRLHLLFNEPKGEPRANSLLARLWPSLQSELEMPQTGVRVLRPPATGSHDRASSDELPPLLLRLLPDWHLPALPEQKSGNTSELAAPARPEPDSFAGTEDPALRNAGIVFHRTLVQVVADGPDRWDEQRIETQKQTWRVQLRQLGVTVLDSTLAQINRALETMLASDTGRWLLDSSHAGSACELRLWGPAGAENPRMSIIDRTFIDEGIRWVIDYKLAAPAAGESLDRFLAGQRLRYSDQLRRYCTVLAGYAAGGNTAATVPVRGALYFPLLDHLQVIDLGNL